MANRKHIHLPTTLGEKIADAVADRVGSWSFILIQSALLAAWVICNSVQGLPHWDVPPFILLNLMLSFQAAFTGPFVMMSQNRQASKDRKRDDLEATEVQDLHGMNKLQLEILGRQNEMLQGIEALRSEMALLRESVPKRRVSKA